VRTALRLRGARLARRSRRRADLEDTPEVFFFCPDCAEREFG
jgi:hypothetical protein